MYGLQAIKDSGDLLTGEVDGMKLGYYAGKVEGGPDAKSECFACCLPVVKYGKDGEYRHDWLRQVWVWHPSSPERHAVA